jgi:NADH dehydrogenase
LKSGRLLASKLIVNTIGTEPVKLISRSGFELEKGRIKTDASMQVPGTDNLWALGDCAITINAFDGKPTPPTAQFALREAKQLARNMVRRMAGKPTMPFRFRPQGLLASIGRNNGVAEIYGFQFSGRLAWMMWRAIYLSKIPTLPAKIGIALDWTIAALFRPPVARIRIAGGGPGGREHYASGDAIHDSDRVSLVESGRVEVYLANTKKPLAEFQEGDYFGTSLLDADSRNFDTLPVVDQSDQVVGLYNPMVLLRKLVDGETVGREHSSEMRAS